MNKNILIIPGWLNSAERYLTLSEKLSKFGNVDIYEFEGFGNTKFEYKSFNILKYYEDSLKEFLKGKRYDLIITHSMGGNILLKALNSSRLEINHVILSNTAYNGVPLLKPIAWIIPVNIFLFSIIKILPENLIKPILKKISLLTIQDTKYFDDIMFRDILKCNPIVASISLFQLTFDNFRFTKTDNQNSIKFIVTYSDGDRIIPLRNTRKLIEDLCNPTVKVFKNIGHTVALEAEHEYYELIKDTLLGQEQTKPTHIQTDQITNETTLVKTTE